MKINRTVALTFLLLIFMLGAGIFTGTWGFAIGREALKGITQPDSRPTNKGAAQNSNVREEITLLKEEDILKSVKSKMNNGRSSTASSGASSQSKPEQPKSESNSAAKLPMTTQANGVAMDVTGIRKQGEFLLLDVALKNNSNQTVKFLYNFLNVTDDKGRLIVADTTGLPPELPSKSDRFTGTISIPTSMLDDAQKISLQLSDYPDQKLQLKLADIPIKSP